MDYPWAERFGELARERDIALSVHAPLVGFMGHLEASGRKYGRSALGDARPDSAGIATAAGAEVVVFHPGFLLGRDARATRSTRSSSSSATLRERLEAKDRGRPVRRSRSWAACATSASLDDVRRRSPRVPAGSGR